MSIRYFGISINGSIFIDTRRLEFAVITKLHGTIHDDGVLLIKI